MAVFLRTAEKKHNLSMQKLQKEHAKSTEPQPEVKVLEPEPEKPQPTHASPVVNPLTPPQEAEEVARNEGPQGPLVSPPTVRVSFFFFFLRQMHLTQVPWRILTVYRKILNSLEGNRPERRRPQCLTSRPMALLAIRMRGLGRIPHRWAVCRTCFLRMVSLVLLGEIIA